MKQLVSSALMAGTRRGGSRVVSKEASGAKDNGMAPTGDVQQLCLVIATNAWLSVVDAKCDVTVSRASFMNDWGRKAAHVTRVTLPIYEGAGTS
jgi:hypothetical protein